MSLNQIQKLMYEVNRNPEQRQSSARIKLPLPLATVSLE